MFELLLIDAERDDRFEIFEVVWDAEAAEWAEVPAWSPAEPDGE